MTINNRTIVEIHMLETTGPGNLNRDDTGSPKTVVYGGATRARVSSQSWKRATRKMFEESFDSKDLGVRTKRVVEELMNHINSIDSSVDQNLARKTAESVFSDGAGIKLSKPRKAAKDSDEVETAQESGYLFFMGRDQYDQLARIAIEALSETDPVDAVKKRKKEIKKIVADDTAIDVALFGRMVADDTKLNVDASAQVAHAISIQAVEPEFDFFTAVDDLKEKSEDESDAGAGMMGDVEFNAPTFYRYANVDANRLNDTLGDPQATAKAIAVFVKSFVTSMPTGKQNTFATHSLPELVMVNVRDTQAVNLIGAFERPVEPDYVQHAAQALVKRERELDEAYDVTPIRSWAVSIGEDTEAVRSLVDETTSLSKMVEEIAQLVSSRLVEE